MIIYRAHNPYYWSSFEGASSLNYSAKEEDGTVRIEVEVPGINKEQLTLRYKSEDRSISIKISGDHPTEKKLYISQDIQEEKLKASLALGILKITAPIKNADRTIQID